MAGLDPATPTGTMRPSRRVRRLRPCGPRPPVMAGLDPATPIGTMRQAGASDALVRAGCV